MSNTHARVPPFGGEKGTARIGKERDDLAISTINQTAPQGGRFWDITMHLDKIPTLELGLCVNAMS
jgi:hypothetical protein